MTQSTDSLSQRLDDLVEVANTFIWQQRKSEGRTLVALAGPPGAGKSTLAAAMVDDFGAGPLTRRTSAANLPMDGFHFDNEHLKARGLLEAKGSPNTFDVDGLVKLARKVKSKQSNISYPTFDRARDCVVEDGGVVDADTDIIIFEGNYLLCTQPPWNQLSALFDVSIFLAPSLETLDERLTRRWLDHGLDPKSAKARAQDNDLKNARFVLANSRKADLTL